MRNLLFWKKPEAATGTERGDEEAIIFKTNAGIKEISRAQLKTTEFCSFLSYSVKYGNQEVTAIGTGSYSISSQCVKINGIYPVLDASGDGACAVITASSRRRLHQALEHWKEEEEVAILHTHPHFSSIKSQTDDQRAIRMACLLFGGIAAMVIVDPFSNRGVDISAYAIDPQTKIVRKVPLELVP